MKNIFFHNDIDGIMSAAAFCLATKAFDDNNYVLRPVPSVCRGQAFEKLLNGLDNIYIFDYQYDSRATLWIDHHQNDKIGDEAIMMDKIVYDYRAKSAFDLVCSYVSKYHKYEIRKDVIDAVNMIDSADYPSVEYIFSDTSPLMVLRSYLELEFPAEQIFSRLVELIVKTGFDIGLALKIANIDNSCVRRLRQKAMSMKQYIAVFGKVSVIRPREQLHYPRYAEILSANAKYNVRIFHESKAEKKISLSFNKWYSEGNGIHLGDYLNKTCKRGGGHFNIGGGIIDSDKVEKWLDDFSILVGE
jgi:hypothetical protein